MVPLKFRLNELNTQVDLNLLSRRPLSRQKPAYRKAFEHAQAAVDRLHTQHSRIIAFGSSPANEEFAYMETYSDNALSAAGEGKVFEYFDTMDSYENSMERFQVIAQRELR